MNAKNKIIKISQIEKIVANIKKNKKTIALCSGCFDVLHSGHTIFFSQCKNYADILFVVVGRDVIIKQNKGKDRPINNENNRMFLVASLEDVNYVILGENAFLPGKIDFYNIAKLIKPDFFILNNDDSAINEKAKLCKEFSIKLKLVKRTVPKFLEKTSSTQIIEKIKRL